MSADSPYAVPRAVAELADCDFYHTMDIPGHGRVEGAFDLRAGINAYLGHVDFKNKRVLDVGAASGFLSFTMERLGAEVVSYDLSPNHPWDIVPYAGVDDRPYAAQRREHIRRLNNGYWLCHRALGSKARMVHGTVYRIPAAIGPVDIATVGSILLHLRDPFLALQSILQLTRETVVVADMIPRRQTLLWLLGDLLGDRLGEKLGRLFRPKMTFEPRIDRQAPKETWWSLSPEVIRRMLGVLGFEKTRVVYHHQPFHGSRRLFYTLVGTRTRSAPNMQESASSRAA